LLLVNYRPEYQHGWGSKPCYTQLRLDPLAPESADAFLETLLGSDPSLQPLKTLLIERTEGNPFFLEESVRTLVETQVLVGGPGGHRLAQDLPTIQVPPTVQAVLAARIDRLPQDEKRLLQTAAVIGTEVPFTLLQAIDLRLLLSMPLMACGEFGRGFNYLREAEALAQALDDQRRLGEVLVQMTRHFRMLGDYDNAIEFGQRGRAIAMALGDFPLQVMANAYLGQVHHAVGEYRQAIDFLRQNVASLAGNLRYARFQGRTSPAVISYVRLIWCQADLGAFAEGIPLGEEGIRIAEVFDTPYERVMAYSAAGYLWLRKGDLSKAIPILERGLHLCQEAHIYDLLPRSASALGAAYALSERLAAALPLLEHGMEQAASTGNMGSHALWLASLGEAYLFAGRQADALALTERALALARAHKERGSEAYTLQILGAIHAHCDPPDTNQAENYYQQALALANELGMRPLQAHCHRGLGTLYRQAGQSEQARAELSTAISMYRDMEMTFWLPQAEVALEKLTS
jgi:tetratricopeptide (TPR) repeat protein